MSNNLVPWGDKSVEELKQISTAMQQYISTESETALKTILGKIGQNPGLISRFFPNALQKQEQRVILQRMRSTAKASEAMYKLYTNVQLEIAKRQSNALIASVELDLQAKLSSFAMVKLEEVQQTFNTSRQRFVERIRPELENIESYKDIPDLYQLAVQSIQEDQRVFFEIIEKLRSGFSAAIERKIESVRR